MKEKFDVFFNHLKPKLKHPMLICVWISLALNLFVEMMSRDGSIIDAIVFAFKSPLVFLYNGLIILITVSIALFFKRRTFVFTVVSLVWMIIGITDFVLLQFRTTPFTATDIMLIKSALDIWEFYLKFYHLILIGVVFILIVLGCIIVFKKSTKYPRTIPYWKLIIFSATIVLSTLGLTEVGIMTKVLAKNFGNIANAYHTYGLPYCFVNGIINTGVDKPDIYSTDVVSTIVDAVEQGKVITSSEIEPTKEIEEKPVFTPTPTPSPTPLPTPSPTPIIPETMADEKTPNIIMLQLESFFDPTRIIGSKYSKDPIPTFRALKENFSSGFLSVPSVGAGTANTEFEVITGMNLDFFGPGEYPYKTILQKKTAESMGYNLKNLGYATHAIHNNTGTFYDRNYIFSQLGFDSFTSIEYMQNIERTPLNWAKDAVLTPEILNILDSTLNQDYVYAISVQGHGSYPDSELLDNPAISISLSEDLSKDLYYPLLYYVNQIYEMDQFIKTLTDELSKRDEKTILVMYGDHLPSFPIDETNLANENLFQTEYIIWSNYTMEQVDQDLEAYQLAASVFDQLDIHEGLITKLHQTQKNSDIYLDELQVLIYDMLYGNMDCFGGVNPYIQTDLQMGTDTISVSRSDYVGSSTEGEDGLLVINGHNFTPYSKIYINDEFHNTIFINSTLLVATLPELVEGDKINVIQSGNDMYELSRTEDYFYVDDTLNAAISSLTNLSPTATPVPEKESVINGYISK